ncbi:MAG: prepilin-type N-terminal cleavage/methylation domain-containing protein [Opitutaceae bacterium]|nr:prepilin-type N-terminal cleavage/methylation domain-containing protein [Opitutaceae bacterium]
MPAVCPCPRCRERRRCRLKRAGRGFTLIELLVVLAIVGLLAGLMVPTVGAVHTSVDKTRTRLQFSQWTLACEQFRQEYGFLPVLGTGSMLKTTADTQAFVRALSGRNLDGTEVAAETDLMGNTRRITFHAFAETELRQGLLADAFGNTEIGVLCDLDADGLIKPGVDGVVPAVGAGGGANFAPDGIDLAPTGVRAAVIFYSAGKGMAVSDLVFSWK